MLAAAAVAEADAEARREQSAAQTASASLKGTSRAHEAAKVSEAQPASGEFAAAGEDQWQALPVSSIQVGDRLWVFRQEPARHTGISIQEQTTEK